MIASAAALLLQQFRKVKRWDAGVLKDLAGGLFAKRVPNANRHRVVCHLSVMIL